MSDAQHALTEETTEEFGELLRFTLAGWLGGLALGAAFDALGLARSGLAQAVVRTFAGEGESLFEGVFAIRKRLRGARISLAQAYGWGKLAGMAVPWVVDGASRLGGVDVHGVPGFYVPFFYAMSDQIGAAIAGFAFLRRRLGAVPAALGAYLTHPVMLTGLAVIAAVPLGLLAARAGGFRPSTQVLTALETIAANLCWLPPLVGWLALRRGPRDRD